MIADGRYLAAKTVSDVWICYPWEATYVFLGPFAQATPHATLHNVYLLSLSHSLFLVLIPFASLRDIDEHDKLAASQTANY